jgi:hypothetical protein
MTVDEYVPYLRRVTAMKWDSLAEYRTLLGLIGEYDFKVASGNCERINGPKGCEVAETTPFFRALLAESDPAIEDFLYVKDRPVGKSWAESIRTAFILGKDGKAKIIVETPGDARALSAVVIAGGAQGERRIGFRLLDHSGRKDVRDYPQTLRNFAVYITDDPGELAPLADGSPPSLLLSGIGHARGASIPDALQNHDHVGSCPASALLRDA